MLSPEGNLGRLEKEKMFEGREKETRRSLLLVMLLGRRRKHSSLARAE